MMKLSDFFYSLPDKLIAQAPLEERDAARLMVLSRHKGSIQEKVFRDIASYLNEGDCLVLNDTRVIPARLYGRRGTGGEVEIFLLETGPDTPRALIRASRRIREGEVIEIEGGHLATVLGAADAGRFVRFNAPMSDILRSGHVPLPPYISRDDVPLDQIQYQTVYAVSDGATAAPTAGLHFTRELLDKIAAKGVKIAYVTLHTSYGSFAPVKAEVVEKHKMHSEFFEISKRAADIINSSKKAGGKIIAVGTTSARVIETSARENGLTVPMSGETDLFIYPGYMFKAIDGMITNFHLPESTLLMLVAAFAGREFVLKAYEHAVRSGFRFFSYGDAMLVV